MAPDTARDRLLLAGAELLDEAQGGEVSTRAICERAGVQAPTLYHHFGSKQGLLDAVLSHGFKAFLAARAAEDGEPGDDPIAAIRDGWDRHVRFGLENPNFYMLIYGRARPGEPCAVVADVEAMILAALRPAARAGRLRVPPEQAARQILAASTGVVLTLITEPREAGADAAPDLTLSDQIRDAVLGEIATAAESGDAGDAIATAAADGAARGAAPAAIALAAALEDDPGALSPGEATLMREWLSRLGRAGAGRS